MGSQRVGHDWETFTFTFPFFQAFLGLWYRSYFTVGQGLCWDNSEKETSLQDSQRRTKSSWRSERVNVGSDIIGHWKSICGLTIPLRLPAEFPGWICMENNGQFWSSVGTLAPQFFGSLEIDFNFLTFFGQATHFFLSFSFFFFFFDGPFKKYLLDSLQYQFCFMFWLTGLWDLNSQTGNQTHTPCIGRCSLNHWKVPSCTCQLDILLFYNNPLASGPPWGT